MICEACGDLGKVLKELLSGYMTVVARRGLWWPVEASGDLCGLWWPIEACGDLRGLWGPVETYGDLGGL